MNTTIADSAESSRVSHVYDVAARIYAQMVISSSYINPHRSHPQPQELWLPRKETSKSPSRLLPFIFSDMI